MTKSPKDWSPTQERELRESGMTVKFDEKMHDVELYNDDNGFGLTACGIKVGPWDKTWAGQMTCLNCIQAAKKAAEKRASA